MSPLDLLRSHWREHARSRPVQSSLTMTGEGLVLGATVLAEMRGDADEMPLLMVEGTPERILALLSVAYGKTVRPETLGNIRRAANEWSRGETCLAQIHLAHSGLPRLPDDDEAPFRLFLGDKLLAEGLTPRELIKACGLDTGPLDLLKSDHDADQPRVPAGNPDGGQWAAADASPSTVDEVKPGTEFVAYKPVHGLPDDAAVVTPPDGKPIEDGDSKTKNLMAPSRADYRQVYAAGHAIASLPLLSQVPAIRAAVAQGGTYDFQRDPTKGYFYDTYTNASNYAVGVYMSGAGHSLAATKAAAETYALFYSSNYGSAKAIHWIERGWRDATAGRWQ
jgi:hypothetical protein